MQYGGYEKKTGKETRPEELAKMAREMAMTVMRVEKEKPGCIVERAEFVIKEDTIAWKVALLEPGEERKKEWTICGNKFAFCDGNCESCGKKPET